MLFATVPTVPPEADYVFYDGYCGLCHRTVRFVRLPDSIVVLACDGRLLVRSNAILHILRSLGGGWKRLAATIAIVPRPIRDVAYDLIARIRYLVFGRRDQTCPLVPPDVRARFDP
jgi:predicted DCC family thiol-disulfide oxidoreductase YuxK